MKTLKLVEECRKLQSSIFASGDIKKAKTSLPDGKGVHMAEKRISKGYTTGTCAQAATRAAMQMLFTGEK